MEEWLAYLPTDRDGQMQLGYIVFCLIILIATYWAPNVARRDELSDPVPTRRADEQRAEVLARRRGLRVPRIFSHLEGPGLGAVMHFMIIAGMALAALIGWRIPNEIERIYGDGARFGLIFPDVTMNTLGKGAQVIGAVTFGLVALRLLRLIIPVMTWVLTLVVAGAAIQYVFDVSLREEFTRAVERVDEAVETTTVNFGGSGDPDQSQ